MINELTILLSAFVLDFVLGDPRSLPHLIVLFGKMISVGDRQLNKGDYKKLKGGVLVLVLVGGIYCLGRILLGWLFSYNVYTDNVVSIVLLFYCLANRTLIKEGKAVWNTLLEKGLEEGRKRLSWIVGRQTDSLNEQQIKKAVCETMSENLSDGVIAPLFYFAILGVPGALAYKMINTLDSMIAYKSYKYKDFGFVAAKLDDLANLIPARITAFLILVVNGKLGGIPFVLKEGKKHSSPNAGYPEAALAYVLDCQFGGPNYYYGKLVDKPFIGSNPREIGDEEIKKVSRTNLLSSIMLVALISIWLLTK